MQSRNQWKRTAHFHREIEPGQLSQWLKVSVVVVDPDHCRPQLIERSSTSLTECRIHRMCTGSSMRVYVRSATCSEREIFNMPKGKIVSSPTSQPWVMIDWFRVHRWQTWRMPPRRWQSESIREESNCESDSWSELRSYRMCVSSEMTLELECSIRRRVSPTINEEQERVLSSRRQMSSRTSYFRMPKLKNGNERFFSCKLRRMPLNADMLNEYVGPSVSFVDGLLEMPVSVIVQDVSCSYCVTSWGLAMTFSTLSRFCKRNSNAFRWGDGSTRRFKMAAGNDTSISPRIRIFHLKRAFQRAWWDQGLFFVRFTSSDHHRTSSRE